MKYAIFLNGEYPEFTKYHFELLKDRIIYCADGGANYTYKYGLKPYMILGDLDSIKEEIYKYYLDKGVIFKKYNEDKDYTDFELTLINICNLENIDMNNRFSKKEIDFYQDQDIIVFGATGNRLDMTISNLKMLEKNTNMKYISHNNELIYFINKKHIIENMKNKNFSLIANTDLKKLTLKGFRYNLDKVDIEKSLGLVSNIIESNKAIIDVEEGEMLIMINIFC